jgi:hypothetical protein
MIYVSCHSLYDPLSKRRTNVNIAGVNVTGDHFLADVGDTD